MAEALVSSGTKEETFSSGRETVSLHLLSGVRMIILFSSQVDLRRLELFRSVFRCFVVLLCIRQITVSEDNSNFQKSIIAYKPNFKAVPLNTRSIKNKLDTPNEFFSYLNHEFDALAFTETWLTKSDQIPYLENYRSTGLSRTSGRGVGVSIYVKGCFPFRVLHHVCRVDGNVECLAVESNKFDVAAVYRPPVGNVRLFLDFMENLLVSLSALSLPCFILGDINVNTLHADLDSSRFHDIVQSNGFHNAITLPTRISTESVASIDVCVTNLSETCVMPGVIISDISDHLPTF